MMQLPFVFAELFAILVVLFAVGYAYGPSASVGLVAIWAVFAAGVSWGREAERTDQLCTVDGCGCACHHSADGADGDDE